MLTKLKKIMCTAFASLLSCAVISQSHCAYANSNTAKLLREMYRARLEYSSDSHTSQKLTTLIDLIEESKATNWDEKIDWVLNLRIEMTIEDDPYWRGGKLCDPLSCEFISPTLPPYIIADFGESLIGNTWRLKKVNGKMTLEKIQHNYSN